MEVCAICLPCSREVPGLIPKPKHMGRLVGFFVRNAVTDVLELYKTELMFCRKSCSCKLGHGEQTMENNPSKKPQY